MILGIFGGVLAAAVTLFMGAGFWSAVAAYVVTGFCVMSGVLVTQLILDRAGQLGPETATDDYRDRLAEDYSQWIDDPETRGERSQDAPKASRVA